MPPPRVVLHTSRAGDPRIALAACASPGPPFSAPFLTTLICTGTPPQLQPGVQIATPRGHCPLSREVSRLQDLLSSSGSFPSRILCRNQSSSGSGGSLTSCPTSSPPEGRKPPWNFQGVCAHLASLQSSSLITLQTFLIVYPLVYLHKIWVFVLLNESRFWDPLLETTIPES